MRLLEPLVVLAAFALVPLAYADTTFAFYGYAANYVTNSYEGLNVEGSFTAVSGYQGLSNVWQITSVRGIVTNPGGSVTPITGLVPDAGNMPTTADGFIYDDLFYTAVSPTPSFNPPYPFQDGFDYWGLLFSTGDGDFVNLFTNNFGVSGALPVYADNKYTYTNNAYFAISDPAPIGGGPAIGPGFVVVSATPEPSSVMLLGTGVLGMAFAVRRKIAAYAA